ncbi:hypothetical protein AB0Q95_17945 [Streptomyces sp. NPDC059900]|uniref:hypothetical protein n=1 Tax=Streptomyces sp. NPDC059900 TaxID=3155816 RepID=UPI0034137E10
MGRRGSLVATAAAGVLIGLSGPAATASAATGPADGRAVHAVSYAGDLHAVSHAAHPRAGSAADGPGVTVAPTESATSSTSPTSRTDGAGGADADDSAPGGTIADTGAGVLPWIAAGAAGALGVGAVVFAMIRRRSE